MHNIAEFLKDHDPFMERDVTALDRLARRVAVEYFTAGTTIFRQGERPQANVRVIRWGGPERPADRLASRKTSSAALPSSSCMNALEAEGLLEYV
jgi:signal-transduction protein with cAMP-binding, CBS, and nucleotidyltransferase domain